MYLSESLASFLFYDTSLKNVTYQASCHRKQCGEWVCAPPKQESKLRQKIRSSRKKGCERKREVEGIKTKCLLRNSTATGCWDSREKLNQIGVGQKILRKSSLGLKIKAIANVLRCDLCYWEVTWRTHY